MPNSSLVFSAEVDFGDSIQRNYLKAQAAIRQKPISISIDDKASLPLGRITGNAQDFDKSLRAATQRVVAFGVAASVFVTVDKAFKSLISSTIDVEASLAAINVNLDLSVDSLQKFKKELFDIGKNTGQTFDTAAKAAEEFARQGLGAEETAKRVKDALLLTRIAGLSSAKSVEDLTAAVNSFAKSGLTTSEVVNKFVAVDTKFAVSSADLAEAISRVGATAADSGVDIDELIGLVTSLQQTTAAGGPKIGNALKTIFTRLRSKETIQDLRDMGIAVDDISGHFLPVGQVLTDIARKFDSFNDAQKQFIATQVAGGFQVNQLRAALADLAKADSIKSQAQRQSNQATTEAIEKNDKLNNTIKAQINVTEESFKQFFSSFGDTQLTGVFKSLIGGLNTVLGSLNGSSTAKAGEDFGKSFVQGISNVLTGPVLGTVLVLFLKSFSKVAVYAAESLKTQLSLNSASNDRAQVQARIDTLLKSATEQEQIQFALAKDTAEQKAVILSIAQRTTAELEKQAIVARALQESLLSPAIGLPGILGGGGRKPISALGFAAGYNPVASEKSAIGRGVGGAPSGATPVVIDNFAFGSGKTGTVVANSSEYLVKNYANGADAIFNQNMVKSMGLPSGAKKIGAAGGLVPNFAAGDFRKGSLRLQAGTVGNIESGFQVFGDELKKINDLFKALKTTSDSTQIPKLTKEIQSFGDTLDKRSSAKVSDKLEKYVNNALIDAVVFKQGVNRFGDKREANPGLPDDSAFAAIDRSSGQRGTPNSPANKSFDAQLALQTKPIFDRSTSEKFFKKDFQDLTKKSLSQATGGFLAGISNSDRSDAQQVARASVSGNVIDKRGNINTHQLADNIDTNRALAGGKTVQDQFTKTVEGLIDNGKTLEYAYVKGIKELGTETSSRKKINQLITKNGASFAAYEKEVREAKENYQKQNNASKKQIGAAIDNQLVSNSASKALKGGQNFNSISKEQQVAVQNTLRGQAAEKLFGNTGASLPQLLKNKKSRDAIEDEVLPILNQLRQGGGGGPPPLPKQKQGLLSKAGSALNGLGAVGLGIGASLAAAFVPSGPGGTNKGIALGATSSALQGAGLGSLFGAPGAAVGGVAGALVGAFGKIRKSSAELSEELDKGVQDQADQTTTAEKLNQTYKDLNEAIANGDSQGKVNGLRTNAARLDAKLTNRDLASLIASGDQKAIVDALNSSTNKTEDTANANKFAKSFDKLNELSLQFSAAQDKIFNNQAITAIPLAPIAGIISKQLAKVAAPSSISLDDDSIQALASTLNKDNTKSIDFGSVSNIAVGNDKSQEGIKKLQDTFGKLNPAYAKLALNINTSAGAATGLLKAFSLYTDAATKAAGNVAKGEVAGRILPNLESFAGTNLQGEATAQAFGSPRIPGGGSRPNNELNINKTFAELVDRLDQLKAFGKDGIGGVSQKFIDTRNLAEQKVDKQGVLSISADIIRSIPNLNGTTLTNDRGELNEKAISAALDTLVKSTDTQTALIAQQLKLSLAAKNSNIDVLSKTQPKENVYQDGYLVGGKTTSVPFGKDSTNKGRIYDVNRKLDDLSTALPKPTGPYTNTAPGSQYSSKYTNTAPGAPYVSRQLNTNPGAGSTLNAAELANPNASQINPNTNIQTDNQKAAAQYLASKGKGQGYLNEEIERKKNIQRIDAAADISKVATPEDKARGDANDRRLANLEKLIGQQDDGMAKLVAKLDEISKATFKTAGDVNISLTIKSDGAQLTPEEMDQFKQSVQQALGTLQSNVANLKTKANKDKPEPPSDSQDF